MLLTGLRCSVFQVNEPVFQSLNDYGSHFLAFTFLKSADFSNIDVLHMLDVELKYEVPLSYEESNKM
jgi:hypothetical protein